MFTFPEGHGSMKHSHTALKITEVMDGPKQQGGEAGHSFPAFPGLQINCICRDGGSRVLVVIGLRWLPARPSSPCSKEADPAG